MARGGLYVTGAHNIKVGYTGSFTEVHNGRVPNNTQLRYTFNAGAPEPAPPVPACTVQDGNRLCPVSVSYFLSPRWDQHDRTETVGFYAQDQWTIGRLTLQGGVRYDRAWSWAPADGNGTTETSRFNPQPITFERTVSVRGYNDITPRFGVAYDLFGTGKTALKVQGGKYLEAATSDSIYSSNNPAARIVTRIGSGGAAARGWTDGNRNFVVDCDLLNPVAQDNLASGGDLCNAVGGLGLNFGNTNPNTTTINPEILGGWGVRPNDWQFGVSVQHELVPRVSVEGAYNRRWWGNFFVTDNVLATAADYDTYSIAIPEHDNLPGGGDTASFVAITQAANNRGSQLYMTSETDFGDARTSYWHGFDFTATARLAAGVTIQGGTSTGRGVRNNCDITSALPELLGSARVDSCDVTEQWATSFRGLASYTVPEDRRAGERQHAVSRNRTGRRRRHQRALVGGELPGAEFRHPAVAGAPSGECDHKPDDDGEPAQTRGALLAGAHQSRRHALREDLSLLGQAGGRRCRLVQPVQLERHDRLSADVPVPDERREVADTHGDCCASAGAVPRDAELLSSNPSWATELGPARRIIPAC